MSASQRLKEKAAKKRDLLELRMGLAMSRVDQANAADAPCQLTMVKYPMAKRKRAATTTMIGLVYREDAMALGKDAVREADLLAGRGPVSGWKKVVGA